MNRKLLIAVTLAAFGLHAVTGCCSYHAHASVRSECLCAETPTGNAHEFGCDTCPDQSSGDDCDGSGCVWIIDEGPTFEFDPEDFDSVVCFGLRNATDTARSRHCVSTAAADVGHSRNSRQSLLSVWRI